MYIQNYIYWQTRPMGQHLKRGVHIWPMGPVNISKRKLLIHYSGARNGDWVRIHIQQPEPHTVSPFTTSHPLIATFSASFGDLSNNAPSLLAACTRFEWISPEIDLRYIIVQIQIRYIHTGRAEAGATKASWRMKKFAAKDTNKSCILAVVWKKKTKCVYVLRRELVW